MTWSRSALGQGFYFDFLIMADQPDMAGRHSTVAEKPFADSVSQKFGTVITAPPWKFSQIDFNVYLFL